jgi:hypothetical protein
MCMYVLCSIHVGTYPVFWKWQSDRYTYSSPSLPYIYYWSTVPTGWMANTSRPGVVRTREKRDLERKCQENIDIWVKVVRCVQSRPASAVDSVLRSDAVQNKLCWLACSVHKGPPSPKFQIPPSQLRQRADRAAGRSVKGLWCVQQLLYLALDVRTPPPPTPISTLHTASLYVQMYIVYSKIILWCYVYLYIRNIRLTVLHKRLVISYVKYHMLSKWLKEQ